MVKRLQHDFFKQTHFTPTGTSLQGYNHKILQSELADTLSSCKMTAMLGALMRQSCTHKTFSHVGVLHGQPYVQFLVLFH